MYRMHRAKVRADRLRVDIYNMTSCWRELRYWVGGMSRKISAVMNDLHTIRGHIAVRHIFLYFRCCS